MSQDNNDKKDCEKSIQKKERPDRKDLEKQIIEKKKLVETQTIIKK